eukprot:gene1365-1706_t
MDAHVINRIQQNTRLLRLTDIEKFQRWLSHGSSSAAVKQLCCQAIGSVCQLRQGRAELIAADGIAVLTAALVPAPDEAVAALQVVCSCSDGAAALLCSPCPVTRSLLTMLESSGISYSTAAKVAECVTGNTELLEVLRAVAAAMVATAQHEAGRSQLRQAECIPVLARMLDVADETVQASTASCLAALTVEVQSKLPVMAAAGEQLIKLLLQSSKQGTAAAARTALLGAAGNLDARRKLELLLPGSELTKLLGPLSDAPPDYKYCVWDSGK